MSVGGLDELDDLLSDCRDIVGIVHIRDGGAFRDVQPGVVLVVEGRLAGKLRHTVLVQTAGDAQLVLEERKAGIIFYGTGRQSIVGVGFQPERILKVLFQIGRRTAQSLTVGGLVIADPEHIVLANQEYGKPFRQADGSVTASGALQHGPFIDLLQGGDQLFDRIMHGGSHFNFDLTDILVCFELVVGEHGQELFVQTIGLSQQHLVLHSLLGYTAAVVLDRTEIFVDLVEGDLCTKHIHSGFRQLMSLVHNAEIAGQQAAF